MSSSFSYLKSFIGIDFSFCNLNIALFCFMFKKSFKFLQCHNITF